MHQQTTTASRGEVPRGSGVLWWQDSAAPTSREGLKGALRCDLAIIGGGYFGLWSALHALQRNPRLRVAVIEAGRVGGAASGRNGGFVSSSLTHGIANGLRHWPQEFVALERLGLANLDAMEREIDDLGIDCDFERVGKIAVATRPHEIEGLAASVEVMRHNGRPSATILDRDAVRKRLDSPTFLGGMFDPVGSALVHPARLAWGLAAAAEQAGITIHEHTRAEGLAAVGSLVEVSTASGTIVTDKVILATNAYPSLLRSLRWFTVPVYDYALATAPLSDAEMQVIGWQGREGFTDSGNEFHYFRLTPDRRILWGGYDAIYHYGNGIRDAFDEREETFDTLAGQFRTTFPQLSAVPLEYGWGGVIDTCTRFNAFYGTALAGKVGYAAGFTGLGVAATRFAADVVLDLLAGADTELTRLTMVRRRPLPWPPEPLRSLGISWTKQSLAASDAGGGRRNSWLRVLDSVGVGFDS